MSDSFAFALVDPRDVVVFHRMSCGILLLITRVLFHHKRDCLRKILEISNDEVSSTSIIPAICVRTKI